MQNSKNNIKIELSITVFQALSIEENNNFNLYRSLKGRPDVF